MKQAVCIVFLILASVIYGQNTEEVVLDITEYQTSENKKFGDPETTILETEDLEKFEALEFYPINLKYRVTAKFIRTPDEKPFLMPTTTSRLPEYVKYGEVHFMIDGVSLELSLFQNTTPYEEPGYEDYLFLPFTDLTSGDGSYGGGRFLDTRIPEGDTMILDFNKAYNPYCAYNKNYSCPIPPKENDLLVRIEAGVKDFGEH